MKKDPEASDAMIVKQTLHAHWVDMAQFEEGARRGFERRPWILDEQADDVVQSAPMQCGKHVPPKSVARDAAEEGNATQIYETLAPRTGHDDAERGEPGAGTTLTSMRRSPLELLQHAHWRVATLLRLGMQPEARANATCSFKKSGDGEMRELVLTRKSHHATPHGAIWCTTHRLITQACGCADLERDVPEPYEQVRVASRCEDVLCWTLRRGSLESCSKRGST